VVSFRPTPAQAAGRGAYLGGVVGLAGAPLLLAVGTALRAGLVRDPADRPAWLAAGSIPLAVPVLVALLVLFGLAAGALTAVVFGRSGGADIDDLGIRPVPAMAAVPLVAGGFASWQRVRDLRCQRRGGRTRVVVYLDSGQTAWLRAPYHGRWLAADPEFERKLFMLRNLWEIHRSFARDDDAAA
jgi:hypothetical protein